MTPRNTPVLVNPQRSLLNERWGVMLTSCLFISLVPAVVGCGAQSADPLGSTDTGNPPVIAETKLRVMAAEEGVVVSGGKGAVSAGADIDVTNLSTSASAETKANDDGSFEVTIAGSVSDEYRVEAALNGKRARAEVAGADSVPALNGHTFLLDSSEGYEPVDDTTVRLSFQEGALNFSAGCNSHSAPYTLCDDNLCVNGLAGTEIGCDASLHEQDEWLADFFSSQPSIEYAPPRLTITGDNATLEFLDREAADPDRPLTERVWNIDTFFQGDAASNLPLANAATIQFEDDGTFLVFDTCNFTSGTYSLADDGIVLSDVSTDTAYCEQSLNVQAHIADVMTEGTITYTIVANRLTVMNGDLGLGATTE